MSAAQGDLARPDTKEVILDAAERLFAERGFDGVSVRDITALAGVNVAAVSYYFGSKSGLAVAAFRRRVGELSRERVRLLREAESRAGQTPPLEHILHALLAPPLGWWDGASGKRVAAQLISRALNEPTPEIRHILETDVSHLQQFVPPLMRALPELSREEICWRLHFTLGAMHHGSETSFRRLAVLSEGRCDIAGTDGLLRQMIAFAAAGFRAPGLAGDGPRR